MATASKALEPKSVGYSRTVTASDGRVLEVRTLSVNPPVFSIPGLLSDSEADDLVKLAKTKEFEVSEVDPNTRDMKILKGKGKAARHLLEGVDEDRDGLLSAVEMSRISDDKYKMPNYDHAQFVRFVLGEVPDAESKGVPIKDAMKVMSDYFTKVLKEEPHRKNRYSETLWLKHNVKAVRRLMERASAVTLLPMSIVNNSEELQVVYYPKRGHYACHHDSTAEEITGKGHVRVGTLGVFLNDVTSGGETVFPGAARPDVNKWRMEDWQDLEMSCQRTEACTTVGGVKVTPKKGDAIFWYNVKPKFFPALELGKRVQGEKAIVWNSMHCAADVLEGEKWFANLWFRLLPKPKAKRRKEREL